MPLRGSNRLAARCARNLTNLFKIFQKSF